MTNDDCNLSMDSRAITAIVYMLWLGAVCLTLATITFALEAFSSISSWWRHGRG